MSGAASRGLSRQRRELVTDATIPVDLVVPPGSGAVPAVALLHGRRGPEAAAPLAARLAGGGSLVAVPHLGARAGDPSAPPGAVEALSDIEVLNDLHALLEALREQPRCSGRAAVVGIDWGGRLALLLATSPSAPERTAACFPPGIVKATAAHDPRHPQIPVQRLHRLGSALLLVGAADDEDPSPAHVAEVAGILARLPGAVHDEVVVDGSGDGLLDGPTGPAGQAPGVAGPLAQDPGPASAALAAVEAWLAPLGSAGAG